MKRPLLPRFTRAEVFFSLKSFGAAMLAIYLASRAGLPRPFWALITAYVVAHPLAGAVRSKAIYRVLGTLLGSVAALLLVPTFSGAPELLTLAMALWVGICLFFALLDRTPRSYVLMLAGYTAALIGFPAVETPQLLFDTASARVEEIWLGIFCATVVHSIVLPAGLGPSVLGLLDNTLRDARKWLTDLMHPGAAAIQRDSRATATDRRRLAGDITQLRLLSTHVPFDTTHLRWTASAISAMHDRVAALTPALSAIEDRLSALVQMEGALAPDIAALLKRIDLWLQTQEQQGSVVGSADEILALRQAIKMLGAADLGLSPWQRALRVALGERLAELVDGWRACHRLRRDIDAGLTGAAMPLRHTASLGNRVLHRDYGMALWSTLAAMLAICLCSAFWILTGWSFGSVTTMMAAVFCCFFAGMDDPVPAIDGFLKYTLWSIPISVVYVLVLLPMVQDFSMLVLICAPTFLVAGCYMARPANFIAAMAVLLPGVAGAMSMHDTGQADFVSFANTTLAQSLGIFAAGRVTAVVRSVGADWSARRIQRATWRELGEMASAARAASLGDGYAVRMLDRIGLLAPRIVQAGGTIEGVAASDALRDLRIGADIVTLQRARAHLPTASTARLLRGIAGFFQTRSAKASVAPSGQLLAEIDSVLSATLIKPQTMPEWRSTVAALVGLRRNLFPEASALAISDGVNPHDR